MSKHYILDASALIAVIYEEKGAGIVEDNLSNALISAVNYTEVASYLVRNGADVSLLRDISLPIIPYDENQTIIAAKLLPRTMSKGLSLGDSACLALAITKELPVLTADKAWKFLDIGIKIRLIR